MEYSTAQHALAKLKTTRLFLSVALLLLLLSNLVLAELVLSTRNRVETVVVPATLTSKVTVSPAAPSARYLETMALFFVNERLNVTPKTVEGSHFLLLHYTAPVFYAHFNQVLRQEARVIKQASLASVFYVTGDQVFLNKKQVLITGVLKRWVGDRALAESQKSYLLTFHFNNGLLAIASFKAVTPPRDTA